MKFLEAMRLVEEGKTVAVDGHQKIKEWHINKKNLYRLSGYIEDEWVEIETPKRKNMSFMEAIEFSKETGCLIKREIWSERTAFKIELCGICFFDNNKKIITAPHPLDYYDLIATDYEEA